MLPVRDHLPTRSFPFVNYGLIAINVGVFGFEIWSMTVRANVEAFTRQGLVPGQLFAQPLTSGPTLITHMFLQPSNAAGGVAFVAHVGGFIAGLGLLPLLRTQDRVEYDPWERVVRR